jgi:hypothetical protein
MRNDRSRLTARNRWLRSAFFALGLASAAATAHAQTAAPPAQAEKAGQPEPPGNAAAASNPDPVAGVTVQGRDRSPDTGATVPADKKAEFDKEAAREAAFREYRESRPQTTTDDKGIGDPNDQSKDFPGLQSYVPR